MGAVFSNSNTAATVSVVTSSYRGAYPTVADIRAIANPVDGNYAILERDEPLQDLVYFFDRGLQSWRPQPEEDFQGYFDDLAALNAAIPNPKPTWIAFQRRTNGLDDVVRYVVSNTGVWIDEPDTLDADYVDQRIQLLNKTYSQTGSVIDFINNSFWNVENPLDTDFTLDFTGANIGKCAILHHLGATEPLITSTLPISNKAGVYIPNKLNTYNFIYNGLGVNLVIVPDSTEILSRPSINVTVGSATSLITEITPSTNATSYDLLIATTNDVAQANPVNGYNGTDLNYTIEGLTENTTYYLFLIAKAVGFYNSQPFSISATPVALLIPLFSYDFAGTVLDANKFSNSLNQANTSFTQDEVGTFNELATAGSNTGQQITTEGLFTFDTSQGDRYIHFDINRLGVTNSFFQIYIGGANSNAIRIMTADGENNVVKLLNSISGGSVAEDISTTDFTGTFKAALINQTITLYKWNGNAWNQVAQAAFGDDTYYIRFSKGGNSNAGSLTEIDNVFVMDQDSINQYPIV